MRLYSISTYLSKLTLRFFLVKLKSTILDSVVFTSFFFLCFFRDEVERLAKECKMRLYRTSVKEDLNVSGVFQHLAENYVNKVKSFTDSNNSGYGMGYQVFNIGIQN